MYYIKCSSRYVCCSHILPPSHPTGMIIVHYTAASPHPQNPHPHSSPVTYIQRLHLLVCFLHSRTNDSYVYMLPVFSNNPGLAEAWQERNPRLRRCFLFGSARIKKCLERVNSVTQCLRNFLSSVHSYAAYPNMVEHFIYGMKTPILYEKETDLRLMTSC